MRYFEGDGVPLDDAKAIEWLEEAAMIRSRVRDSSFSGLGLPEARFILGKKYAEGDGVPRDEAKASWYYGVAAGNGHEEAARELKRLRAGQ